MKTKARSLSKVRGRGARPYAPATHRIGSVLVLILLLVGPDQVCVAAGQGNDGDVLQYIRSAWTSLTRSMTDCKSLVDPKFSTGPVLYLPVDFAEPPAITALKSKCKVDVEHLPAAIHRVGDLDISKLCPGLLYLPDPYVVPGGMFNEMYGWDSYFIIRGLLEDGNLSMARNMLENFLFEVEHYGAILNSNRTYHLTRSQPPLLTEMLKAIYEAELSRGQKDTALLVRAYPDAVALYQFWVSEPHLAGHTGLSRYFDFGDGPPPELGPDIPSYFRGVVDYLLLHPGEAVGILVTDAKPVAAIGPRFSLRVCDEESSAPAATERSSAFPHTHPGSQSFALRQRAACDKIEDLSLSPDFYKGDRSMRESGYDISFRFGPFGAATHHYAPVDLNSLLYQTETDLGWISREIGHPEDAVAWEEKARLRRTRIDQYCGNANRGLYFDYDFERGMQSSYEFATTFYPLWVGAASPSQAEAVEKNFRSFDRPGGIDTSPYTTGAQWDNPYAWAPVQLIACEGLRRYGDSTDADLVSRQFLSTVAENFRRDKTIREKYNVVTRSSETQVRVGYAQNQVGFGWTNGAYLVLRHELHR